MRLTLLFGILVSFLTQAQLIKQPDAAKIKLELKKLNSLGAVLYVAAHPDDENTRAIAYLVNDQLMTTAYLSLTRGDGGQNLIGPEIRDMLGLIRTQELLSARRIDGGQQFFTRAIDFGFSKSAKETFEIWNKQEVLSDVIAVIRQFQPDVILTRFPPDERAGHGQHTASAILAQEAFEKAGDPTVFSDQIKECGVWQAKRLLTNTARWWNQTLTETTPGVVTMNVGAYNPLLGKSSSELAAESRTQHKSQGFGSPGRRGDAQEFFEHARGEKAEKSIFDGINTGWSRLKGGGKVQLLVEKAILDFNEENPSSIVPLLLQIRKEISQLEPAVWKSRKLKDVNQLIQSCLGLFVEATADNYWVSPGEGVTTNVEILNRSNAEVKLLGIRAADLLFYDTLLTVPLKNNLPFVLTKKNVVAPGKSYSSPFWLTEPHGSGLFTLSDHRQIGKPENDPAVLIHFTFAVDGERLTIPCPLIYKWTDPVKGELIRPFEVVPPVVLNLSGKVFLFPNSSQKEISVLVKSTSEKELNGTIKLSLPPGWRSEPAFASFDLKKRGEEATVAFNVFPGKVNLTASVRAIAEVAGRIFDQSLVVIDYDHIPIQTLLPKADAKVVRLDLNKEGTVVGYIKGAGDEIPAGLRNIGYEVWEMKDEEVTTANLKRLDAVILGVRALNTNGRIRHFMPDLLEYVKSGGTMIAQYNTPGLDLEADRIAPYPLSISRDRVTEENSKMTILKLDHPALNYPNKIVASDFDGWVQERGLYFPDKWDAQFEALLSCHDEGEPARDGSLLVANYGSGHYIYTGLSFFRELPEGVPGAYRLFANLVSLGKNKKLENAKSKAK